MTDKPSDSYALDVLCQNRLSVFFQRAWQEVETARYHHNWHIDCISEHLEAVESGEIKRLLINVPPRTGKTLLVNVAFPSWIMGRNPGKKIIGVSYSHMLSEKIALMNRNMMQSQWYRDLFPNTVLDSSQMQKRSFMTDAGGGRFSTSVDGTVTGEGADIIIVDDPHNPAEALSDIKRVSANTWIDQTLFSRLNDQEEGAIVGIMQRLHSDDMTGHLMEKGQFELLKLPAFTEEKKTISIGDKSWEYKGLLHEKRLNRKVLDELRISLGSYAYAGQFLQEPVPLGGGEFKTDWLNYFNSESFDPKPCNIYITVDPANSKKKTSDYTAMCVWALAPDRNYYLVDGFRERLNPTERIDSLFWLHRKWTERSGKPPVVGYEKYGMMSDTHYIEKKQQEENYRFTVIELSSGMNKEERIRRLIPAMERRQVWMPNDIYTKNAKGLPVNLMDVIVAEEMLLFPMAAHDDFIDAMSMIYDIDTTFPSLGKSPNHRPSYGSMHRQPQSVLDVL